MAAPGRPTVMTDLAVERLLTSVRGGNFLEVAIKYAGLGKSTVYDWIAQGRKATEGPFFDFVKNLDDALAEAETTAVEQLINHGRVDYRAVTFYLERRHAARWGAKQQVKIEVESELERTLDRIASKLPAEVFRQVLEAIADPEDGDESPPGDVGGGG